MALSALFADSRMLAEPSPVAPSGFARIDALARSTLTPALVVAHGDRPVLEAVARHVARRAALADRCVTRADGASTAEAWRELAAELHLADRYDPLAVAAELARAPSSRVLLLMEPRRTEWGRAVADELARRLSESDAPGPLVVVLTTDRAFVPVHALGVELATVVSRDDVRLWWQAVAEEAGRGLEDRVSHLDHAEAWWAGAGQAAEPQRWEASTSAQRLLARVALAERGLSIDEAQRLGSTAALDELLGLGALRQDGPRGSIRVARPEPFGRASVDDADRLDVAQVLSAAPDPWAIARASELFARAHRGDDAFDALERALGRVSDPDARADFWNRWSASLACVGDARAYLLRSASLALRLGDVDRAVEYARRAASADGGGFEPMLMLGRATAARGDLTTAAIALAKAMDRAPDAGSRARAAVEIAEVHYLGGDFESAGRLGAEAFASAGDMETRLLARNVLGKLHLASAAWVEAEQHFAADACDAACAADVVGELRARVNRAVALLSGGRRDEARELLLSVLDDGERHGEPRATVFALANLAAMATLRHDYAEALRLSERAIDARRRIGERIGLARLITNLAVLRLRVGLVTEAEAALRFGRQACGPAMPGARLPHFALVAARIHLARGKTAEAARDVAAALQAAGRSSDGGKVGECHRLAARIALEDGDTQRTDEALIAAAREATTDDARAELAVLLAMQARALGRDFEPLASRALELALQVDDAELAREAHVLLHHASTLRGEPSSHLEAAVSLRDRVADALPSELRRTFLARRDLADLAALEAAQRASGAPPPLDPSPALGGGDAPRRSSERAAGALVGEDPAMRALRAGIKKVGASDVTVLVQGESGTGKELVAEAIHAASPRRAGPLVKVNCAALVETLLLSELFGHEKGSFTGAGARRRGRFELAEGGTLFLDEIGDISSKTQVALLRVLQDRTFERVGGTTSMRANVRIVCATHRDLALMVSRGQFREDLYYRLRGIALVVPPLRSRLGDLPRLAEALLARIAAERHEPPKRLSPSGVERLREHAWPGNVRELDNALRAAALFAEGDVIELDDLVRNVPGLRASLDEPPESPRAGAGTPPAAPLAAVTEPSTNAPSRTDGKPVDLAYACVRAGTSLGDLKRQIEQDCIARALADSQGNITHAAALLGMKRPRLSQLVKQYGLGSTEDES